MANVPNRQKTVLSRLAKSGDVFAQGHREQEAEIEEPRALLVDLGVPGDAVAEAWGISGGFKDGFARSTLSGTAHRDLFVMRSAAPISPGPGVLVTSVGDSPDGVTIEEAGGNLTIHFEDGVSTGDDVVAAIAAEATLITAAESGPMADPWTVADDEFVGNLNQDNPGSVATANDFVPINFGPVTHGQPDRPRGFTLLFGSAWSGGIVTIIGTNQFDDPVTETFDPLDGETQPSENAFKTITSVKKTLIGQIVDGAFADDWASVTLNPTVALQLIPANDQAIVFANGVSEVPTAVNTSKATITLLTAPEGTISYKALINR